MAPRHRGVPLGRSSFWWAFVGATLCFGLVVLWGSSPQNQGGLRFVDYLTYSGGSADSAKDPPLGEDRDYISGDFGDFESPELQDNNVANKRSGFAPSNDPFMLVNEGDTWEMVSKNGKVKHQPINLPSEKDDNSKGSAGKDEPNKEDEKEAETEKEKEDGPKKEEPEKEEPEKEEPKKEEPKKEAPKRGSEEKADGKEDDKKEKDKTEKKEPEKEEQDIEKKMEAGDGRGSKKESEKSDKKDHKESDKEKEVDIQGEKEDGDIQGATKKENKSEKPSKGDNKDATEGKDEESQKKSESFAIVSASSANHGNSLKRFCQKIASLVKDDTAHLIVYDLGLEEKQRAELDSEEFRKELKASGLTNPMDLRVFNYSQYPEHYDVNVAKGEYAWKSAIIWEVLKSGYDKLVWIDAGTNINKDISNTTLWEEFKDRISEFGVWTGVSSQTVKEWTHPGMLKYFNISEDDPITKKHNVAATIIGVDLKFEGAMEKIIEPWYRCGRVKACIAPEGSSRENHRQDQAALTVIMHLNEWDHGGMRCDGCHWSVPKFFRLWEEAERGFS